VRQRGQTADGRDAEKPERKTLYEDGKYQGSHLQIVDARWMLDKIAVVNR